MNGSRIGGEMLFGQIDNVMSHAIYWMQYNMQIKEGNALSEGMTPYERVMSALRGEEFDVFPAVSFTSVATVEGMQRSRAFYPEAHTDGRKMADLAEVGYREMGFDTIAPYFSILLEAGALGAEIDWGDSVKFPYVKRKAYKSLDEVSICKDYMEKPELQQLLKAIRILKKKYRGQAAIVGKVMGPWDLAYHLYGVENLVLDMILEPEKTRQMIWRLSEVTRNFAVAQFEAGADIVTWAEHVTRDLVSAAIYEEFVLDVHKEVLVELRGLGPVVLHVCGNVEDRIALFARAGFRCVHLDSRNDIMNCRRECGDKILLAGGINNPITLMQGRKNQIEKNVLNNIRQGGRLIGPECALQPIIPISSLKCLADTIHRQKYQKIQPL